MKGVELKAIQKSLGLTVEQMGDRMGIKKRKITYLRASEDDIELVYELAARAVFFGVEKKPIVLD